MSTCEKDLMLQAIDHQIGSAGDNLYRAKHSFGRCTPEQMNQKWSGNGETRQEVLDQYQSRYDELVAAREAYVATKERK